MNITEFIKDQMKVRVREVEGDLFVNMEDLVGGLYIRKTTSKGKQYDRVGWDKLKVDLESIGFANYWANKNGRNFKIEEVRENIFDEWMHESYFYKMLMHFRNDNEKAIKFQDWLSFEVIPSIRKNNYYINKNHITEEQYDSLRETLFEICSYSKLGLSEASQRIFGNRKELKRRFVNLGYLDYENCHVKQLEIKNHKGKRSHCFIYDIKGKNDDFLLKQKLQVSLSSTGYVYWKEKFKKEPDLGKEEE